MSDHARPEVKFYNSYGNYTHFRFQDFCDGCDFRAESRSCTHPENRLGNDAECLCDFCPLVEPSFQSEDPAAPDYDPTDWSEGEQPIFIVDDALRERWFGARSEDGPGVNASSNDQPKGGA